MITVKQITQILKREKLMKYEELEKLAKDNAMKMAEYLDFEMLWIAGAFGEYIEKAKKDFPLTGKIQNMWDKRTRSGKYLAKVKYDLLHNRNVL